MPQIRMMDGTKVPITQEKADKLVASLKTSQTKWVDVSGSLLNTACISGIYPDELTRQKLTQGRLHDGTRVLLKFGQWVDAERNDVTISAAHYPEITKDMVMDDETWQREIKPLPTTAERRSRFMELMTTQHAHALPPGTTEDDLGGADRGVPALPGADS